MQTTAPKSKRAKAGLAAALAAVLLNLKTALPLLLKGSTWLKMGWLFKTGGSMVVFLVVYAMVFGWAFAAAAVVLIFIHEMGHWLWIRMNGVKAGVPVFIPFIGAVIALKELPADQATRAWVAFAGPLIGGAGALAFWLLGLATNSSWLMAAGSFGFFLNVFQLIPARPLDGGWMIAAISKLLLVPGTIVLVALAMLTHSAFLILIAIIAVVSLFTKEMPPQTVQEKKTIGEVAEQLAAGNPLTPAKSIQEIPATPKQRWAIGAAYLSLAAFLGCMHGYSNKVMQERMNIDSPIGYLMGQNSAADDAKELATESSSRTYISIAGTYEGKVWQGSVPTALTTHFAEVNGKWVGEYVVPERKLIGMEMPGYTGKLEDGILEERRLTIRWHDQYGADRAEFLFNPQNTKFVGRWYMADEVKGRWTGTRTAN